MPKNLRWMGCVIAPRAPLDLTPGVEFLAVVAFAMALEMLRPRFFAVLKPFPSLVSSLMFMISPVPVLVVRPR